MKLLNTNKRRGLAGFDSIAIGVVTVIIIIALGYLVLEQFQTVNRTSFNNSSNVWTAIQTGFNNLGTLLAFVAIVIIVAVVAVIMSMTGSLQRGGGGL